VWKNIHIVSTNLAKTLVWKHGYDVKLWRHKQLIPNTNNHHMPLNETPPKKLFCVRHRGCVVGVARSRRFLGGPGVGFLRTPGIRVGFFYPIESSSIESFFTSKLRVLTRAYWNGTIFLESFIETENSCWETRFSLIATWYKFSYLQLKNPAS